MAGGPEPVRSDGPRSDGAGSDGAGSDGAGSDGAGSDDSRPDGAAQVGRAAAPSDSAPEPQEALAETDGPQQTPALPEPVRQRVVILAAAGLGALRPDEVPAALRRIAKFAPQRRARLGGAAIAAQLAAEPSFRHSIAHRLHEAADELTLAVAAGTRPAAADPVEVAALAYLLRPDNWIELVSGSSEVVRAEIDRDATEARIKEAEQRADRAEQGRAAAAAELDRIRTEAGVQRAELDNLRTGLRVVQKELREAQRRERRAVDTLSAEKGRAAHAAGEHEAELRRLRARLADAEAEVAADRSGGKEARAFDDARVWLLLETVRGAARGLVRELALEPVDRLPAEFVAETAERPGAARARERALASDDPARLDQLLALPRSHLVVDGYNVTKTGYGEISLEEQRNRLVRGLAALAARTGAEVTCVWDGAEAVHGVAPPPRGVRVLFSRKGETADELIRRLVRAEPPGRPLVVVSSDREVADGVRRHGAYPLAAHTLLRRLARA